MLKISEKTNLAIFFLLTVAEAGVTSASVAEVARRWKFVSAGYLEEIVASLRKAGLVAGKKGRGGGYTLARPAPKMTVLDIVHAIDGALAIVETPMHKKMRDSTFEGWCVSRRLWGRVQQGVEQTLRGITLHDLVEEGAEFQAAPQNHKSQITNSRQATNHK